MTDPGTGARRTTGEALVAGVDSSTQSVNVVLCRADDGTVVERYSAPHPDGTECHPRHWEEALAGAAPLLQRASAVSVAAQQHRLVALDGGGGDAGLAWPGLAWPGVADAVDALRGQGVQVSSVRLIGGGRAVGDGTPDRSRRPRGAGARARTRRVRRAGRRPPGRLGPRWRAPRVAWSTPRGVRRPTHPGRARALSLNPQPMRSRRESVDSG